MKLPSIYIGTYQSEKNRQLIIFLINVRFFDKINKYFLKNLGTWKSSSMDMKSPSAFRNTGIKIVPH